MTSWNLITAPQKEVSSSSSSYPVECDCDAVHEACWDCDEDGNEEEDEEDGNDGEDDEDGNEDEDDGDDEVQHKGSRGARICVHTVTSSCLYIIYVYECMYMYIYEWMYVCIYV